MLYCSRFTWKGLLESLSCVPPGRFGQYLDGDKEDGDMDGRKEVNPVEDMVFQEVYN